MKKSNITITSMRALVLFEAAARSGSFSRAAAAAGIGQPAVSHSVRSLETALSVRLFERRHRGVELTQAGRQLAGRVAAGLRQIEQGLDELRQTAGSGVTLLVSTSLASYWLMPRISRFKGQHPGVDLRCITRDTDHDLAAGDFELCIPLGQEDWPESHRWLFAGEQLFPVCSPGYLAEAGAMSAPGDLAGADLLHLEERYRARFDWYRWFAGFGVRHDGPLPGPTFNDYSIVIQAALEGQGIAIGWRHIVLPLLRQGLLVRPVPQSVTTEHPFFIVSPPTRILSPAAEQLRNWLIAEAGAAS